MIGTGEYAWESISTGDEITMVHGPQGGWHILGSVRIARNVRRLRMVTRLP